MFYCLLCSCYGRNESHSSGKRWPYDQRDQHGDYASAASSGAILMPWLIGLVSEKAGIAAGMTCVLIPCVGMLLFSLAVSRLKEE